MTKVPPISQAAVDRFAADLQRLCPGNARLGVAVSGGPDSLALLLLAHAARPDGVEAATVDHRLRASSAGEARLVAEVSSQLAVPHATLPVSVGRGASLQAHAREARYRALAAWATERKLTAVLTAHHADDQAETLLMRLARGAGLTGLSGVREVRDLAPAIRLVRPLLGWRKADLVELVEAAGLRPIDDPANRDPRHDRTAARAALAKVDWLDPAALSGSAGWLNEADSALAWVVERLAGERIERQDGVLRIDAADLPAELGRRLLITAMAQLGASPPRGADLKRALRKLAAGERCTLGGLLMSGGERWTIQREIKARRRPAGAAPG